MDTPKTAAELVAEHTGHDEYLIADEIADALHTQHGLTFLTSGDRALIASIVARHQAPASIERHKVSITLTDIASHPPVTLAHFERDLLKGEVVAEVAVSPHQLGVAFNWA